MERIIARSRHVNRTPLGGAIKRLTADENAPSNPRPVHLQKGTPMPQLKKEITVAKGIILAVSMIIGSGLLGLPGLALELGTPHEALAGWFVIALAMVPMLYIFMALGMRYSTAAGLARYAQEALGEWGGHAVTYLMCGSVLLGMPALASIAGSYIARLLGTPEAFTLPLSVMFIVVMVASNLLGVRATSWVNGFAFISLLFLFAVMIGNNLGFLGVGLEAAGDVLRGSVALRPRNLWEICALLFWAYLGWENLSFGLEEFQNPRRNIPLVYWGSFLLVTFLYLLLALTSTGAELSGQSVKGASGMANLVGEVFAEKGLLFVMVLVLLANGNAWVFSISRLVYASGREGSLPRWVGSLDSRGIPFRSLMTILVSFSAVTLLSPLLGLSVSQRVMLVSQNFVFLFGISIAAFWRVEQGWRRVVFGVGGFVSFAFLISGFSWWAIYPLSLIVLGFLVHRYRRTADTL